MVRTVSHAGGVLIPETVPQLLPLITGNLQLKPPDRNCFTPPSGHGHIRTLTASQENNRHSKILVPTSRVKFNNILV